MLLSKDIYMKLSKFLIIGAVVLSLAGAVSAMAAEQPLFTSFATSATSTPVVVAPATTMYVEHDGPQQNTCYIVLAKNGLGGSYTQVSTSISCVADHVQADFPPTTSVLRG